MEKSQVEIYQRFLDREDALELAQLLKKHKIEATVEEYAPSVDLAFSGQKEYNVKIKNTEFESADKIQLNNLSKFIDKIDPNYYLFSFSDEKLIEILTKSDEWGKFDYLLAQKILKERGKEVDIEEAQKLKKQRLAELSKQERVSDNTYIWAYIKAFLGGIFGFWVAWDIIASKKVLPNGQWIYTYVEQDRKKAQKLLIFSIICMAFWLILSIYFKNPDLFLH